MVLQQIDPDMIDAYIQVRLGEVSRTTVNHELRALNRVFTIAIKKGLTDDNPLRRVDKPSARVRSMDYYEEEEVFKIADKIAASGARLAQRDADLLLVAFYTGLRRAELARLNVEDIDIKERRL